MSLMGRFWNGKQILKRCSFDRNKIKTASKLSREYRDVQVLPPVLAAKHGATVGPKRAAGQVVQGATTVSVTASGPGQKLIGAPGLGSEHAG